MIVAALGLLYFAWFRPERYALGVGYAAQEVPEVPAGPSDVPLDAVATDSGVISCKEP